MRVNSDQGAVLASEQEPFTSHGSLSGHKGKTSTGYLPGDLADAYHQRGENIVYTVLSYATPIAWFDRERGWVIPEVRYSVTTSKQQGKIRRAVGQYATT
jgi:hypothetical protein